MKTVGRKPTTAPINKIVPINEEALGQDQNSLQQLATLELAAHENVVALAHQMGYDGALTVGALEDGIRFYQQRTAEACLELGKRLVLLKEASLHGEFKPRLELLGIEYGAAVRFMGVATKFAKMPTSALLTAAGNQSKLIELLVLDAEEIAELEDGGTVRGMSVDSVAIMGVRELRAALREAHAEGAANQSILDKKNAKIDQLERDKKRINKLPPDDVLTELHKEVATLANEAMGMVQGRVRMGFQALAAHHETHGGDSQQVMAGYAAQLQKLLNELRDEFNLADTVGDGTPAWERWADAQDATPPSH